MKYIDVRWLHSNADDPVRLVSEIGPDRYERRKIEFWSDGRVGYASKVRASRDTRLGERPVPFLAEINSKGEFSGVEIDATAFETLWAQYARADLPRIECSIVFLAESEGGRSSPLPSGALSGNSYRPHLVIGEPTRRHATLGDGNRLIEEYIGVAFHDGPAIPEVGTEMATMLTLIFYPHEMYDKLKRGVTFTVMEGARVVGYGTVRRWLS